MAKIDFGQAFNSTASSLTSDTWAVEPLHYAVHVGRGMFTVCATREEAQAVVNEMTQLNRYFMDGKTTENISVELSTLQVTDPYKRAWMVEYMHGWMGWTMVPLKMNYIEGEAVTVNSEGHKRVYVYAPSAELAMHRAILMLRMAKKEKST